MQEIGTKTPVLGIPLSECGFEAAVSSIKAAGTHGRSVHFANAKTMVDATYDLQYRDALANAWMVLPDGAPVAWLLQRATRRHQQRVSGPDVFEALLGDIALRHFFIAPNHEVALSLQARAAGKIVGVIVPEHLQHWEFPIEQFATEIELAKPTHIWVGIGAPKQDHVALRLAQLTPATVLAVGAALEFSAGLSVRAPMFMRQFGLEWLHRLAKNPQRLWKRYLIGNIRFLWIAMTKK